ncbi:MAG: radical SAM family heme chaperone HemW [Muribaculum sp.]|nr:radical SAM family heme chaperone HemW [Muribaculaceae bacterium]MCM1081547.1 radical SAM family heme chaperone HemW [Muribaculum sp.]
MAGIYIHIPFCHSKCYYCDFYSRPCKATDADFRSYLNALAAEWTMRQHELTQPVSTIYIGGGTPSIVSPAILAELTDKLPTAAVEEFTIEANPEDVTPQWVAGIRELGINRVSMGAQSMNDSELKAVGRRHDAAGTERAYATLRDGGIENISLDLIYGLPGQTLKTWEFSVGKLLDMHPEHLSAYSLTYEEGTRLNAMRLAGKVNPADDEITEAMYKLLCEQTSAAGYEHYEISNFALAGKHARHNSSYWDFTPYVGLGVSAHSFDGNRTRRSNPADIAGYIASMQSSRPFCVEEEESRAELYNDYVITHLRTLHGIDLADVTNKLGSSFAEQLLSDCRRHVATGTIELKNDCLRIPQHYWLISDAILRDLIL